VKLDKQMREAVKIAKERRKLIESGEAKLTPVILRRASNGTKLMKLTEVK
jgi:hypothetical protein